MTKNFILIVIILSLVAVVVFLDVPTIQSVLSSRKDAENKQLALIEKEVFIKTVERLIGKYKDSEEILKNLDTILPTDSDVPNLLVQIEALANGGGMIVNDIGILVGDDKGVSKAETVRSGGSASQERISSDYKIVTVSLNMSGDYNGLKKFLQAVEENMRLIDVESINFLSQSQVSGSIFDFNVVLNTYYYTN